jgi:hypothetical protein
MSVPPPYLHAAVLPPYLLRNRQRLLCERGSARPNWWRGFALYPDPLVRGLEWGSAGLDTFILTCTRGCARWDREWRFATCEGDILMMLPDFCAIMIHSCLKGRFKSHLRSQMIKHLWLPHQSTSPNFISSF